MDIPLDARDAAQAAARREGLSLGEWLTRRILKRYSELNVQEREDAFNQLGQRVTEMCDRLERMEGSARSEPLREAVKKLHQGLGRLSADLVQTTGESTIRMSALSRDLKNVLGKIEEIRGAASRSEGDFQQRIETARQELDVVARSSDENREILTRKFEKLGQTFEEAFSGVSRNAGALQSEMVRIAQGVQALECRFDDARRDADECNRQAGEQAGRIADRLENFGIRLDRVCAATAESATSLHSRIGGCEENLARLDAVHNEATASTAARLQAFDEKIAEAAADASGMCSALDHRLLLVQQGLHALDQRQTQTADALAQGRSWVAEKIAESRAESSSACAALDARLAATNQALCALDRRHSESAQVLADAQRDYEGTAYAVRALEKSVTALENGATALDSRVGAVEADGRIAEHEARLTDLAGRAQAAEAALAGHHEKFATFDGIVGRLDAIDRQHGDMLAQARCDFEQHLRQIVLRTEATERAVESRGEKFGSIDGIVERLDKFDTARIAAIEALEQTRSAVGALQPLEGRLETLQSQIASVVSERENLFGRLDDLAAQQTEAVQRNVQAQQAADARESEFANRFDDICNRTQILETSLDLVQEHTKAVGDLLTSLDARIAGEANKQLDGREELKSELLEEISRSLFAQLDAEARKQEQAIEELHAAFATSTRRALDAKLEEDARNRQPSETIVVAPSPLHAASPLFEASPPPVVAESLVEPEPAAQSPILDLATPAADEGSSEAEIHDPSGDHHESPPPPFPEPGLAAAAAIGALSAAAGESLEPAMAFANEQAGAVAGQASFLSAARQSLRESAQRSETESDPKSLLRFSPFRQPAPHNKRKSDPTSYALLAGVALVAIVAIAVTTGELVKRSHASHAAGTAAATVAVARHAAQRPVAKTVHAATKLPTVEKATAAPKLKQLANAGDPQAQLLLGLQEIGTDTADAAKWLGAAAQQGMPVAQYRIATLYAQGRGVPADPAKAFHWYAEAAKGGNRKAMSNLAVDYAQGSGTTKDPGEAARWFSRAAELGLVDAQFDLAVLYERGLGVPQSLTDAYRWYLIAAKAGDRESKDRVDALVSQLSPQDRAAAEAAAAQFKPQPMNTSANEPQ